MSRSFDHADKLEGYRAILEDRSLSVCLTLERNRQLSDEWLEDLAEQCLEIQDAALAIELLCARAVRGRANPRSTRAASVT